MLYQIAATLKEAQARALLHQYLSDCLRLPAADIDLKAFPHVKATSAAITYAAHGVEWACKRAEGRWHLRGQLGGIRPGGWESGEMLAELQQAAAEKLYRSGRTAVDQIDGGLKALEKSGLVSVGAVAVEVPVAEAVAKAARASGRTRG